MKAIIYAAGVGHRLGPRNEHLPKVLLQFGGKTLLQRHVDSLLAVGVREMMVVTGWRAEQVDAEIEKVLADREVRLSAVRNHSFREGSALSVWTAAEHMNAESAPFLLMDGDVLYGPDLLSRLVRSSHETCLLIDRRCELDEVDPVLVPARSGRPFDFRKGYQGPYEVIGESIGFFKLSPADLPRFIECARARTAPKRRHETLEDIVRELVREDRFGMEDVTGSPWIEIDFPEDLDRALTEVFPAIESGLAKKGSRQKAG